MLKIPKVIILIEPSRLSGRDILRGISRYAQLYGPWHFYRRPPVYLQSRNKLEIKKLKKWAPDGIITRDTENLDLIFELNIPTIISKVIKDDIPGHHTMQVDSASAGLMQTEHLLERGFHNFAFCGFDNMSWSKKNCHAVKSRLDQVGFKLHIYQQPKRSSRRSWENEQFFIADWLKPLPKPLGLIACNDICAQQVIEAAKIAKLRIPEEVAVIGADNDETICDLTDPTLSSISLDYSTAGYQMAERLHNLMKHQNVKSSEIIVKAQKVVVRQSTNTIAIEDPALARAIHFIRKFSKKYLKVNDVVQASGISRRSLERKFQKQLRRSVTEEIKHWHCESIIKMLIETNLPISQIAINLGHPDTKHIARYFKAVKNITPSQYRRQYRK